MARLRQLVVDCAHPASLARFWAAALDDFDIRPYDDAEVARLASLGHTPESDPSVILDGPSMEICFQLVDDPPPTGKRPLHLDVDTSDRTAERARLRELGATVVDEFPSHSWMRDPEGNDFCLVDAPSR